MAGRLNSKSGDDGARRVVTWKENGRFPEPVVCPSGRVSWRLRRRWGHLPRDHFSATNPLGTNDDFHNVGVSARDQNFEALARSALAALAKDASQETMDRLALETDLSELGRFVVTRQRADIGAFKTQQLRNIGITAPYMHNGSLQTLWDVVDHYNKGGEANPFLDGGMEALKLSEKEVGQLVEFLFTLTDKRLDAENQAERTRQAGIAARSRPIRDDNLAQRTVLPFEARLQRTTAGGRK